MPKSKFVLTAAAVVIAIVVVFAVYSAITYPHAALTTKMSFIVGADSQTTDFEQRALNDKVQVQVSVDSGAALWRVQILDSETVMWEHGAGQGGQTTYQSEWIQLPSGVYNFTFRTVGMGSLEATATVTSKGGFW